MADLTPRSGHNMATHNGLPRSQPHTNQNINFKNNNQHNNNGKDKSDQHNPIPYNQFIKSGYSEFEFWLRYCKPTTLTYPSTDFANMQIVQQANVLFLKDFHSIQEVLQFIHECICQHMIWKPRCKAFDNHGNYAPTFFNYCSNWMIIMYQLLWYVKDLEITPELVDSLQQAAL